MKPPDSLFEPGGFVVIASLTADKSIDFEVQSPYYWKSIVSIINITPSILGDH